MLLAATLRLDLNASGLRDRTGQRDVVVDPDGELVVRVANGDHAAARALVARHLPRILNLSRRMLGTQDAAEDVTQEVFLRVWQHAARWRPGQAKFETWLHRVAINLCYDRLRRKPTTALDDIADPPDTAPGPAAALFQVQLSAAVNAALMALPERQREAIVLCHHQGLSNIDAADVMGVSIEAVESLLSRGRRALKERLKEWRADVFDHDESGA